MKEFSNLQSFSKHLSKMISKYPVYKKRFGNTAALFVENESKEKIGHLQDGWKDLAPLTKAQKKRLGYVFNADYNPLYREGDLRDSIHGHFNNQMNKLFLGSASEVAYWQMVGTATIPPRDAIGTTMSQAAPAISQLFWKMFLNWMKDSPAPLRVSTYVRNL